MPRLSKTDSTPPEMKCRHEKVFETTTTLSQIFQNFPPPKLSLGLICSSWELNTRISVLLPFSEGIRNYNFQSSLSTEEQQMELISTKKFRGRGMKVNTGFGCYRQEWSTHAQNEGSRGGCALGRAITKTVENCCSGSTSCEILVRRLQQVGDSRTRIGTDWGRASH